MIDFIFIILPLLYLFLVLSFWTKEYVIGAVTSIGLMVSGVYLAINGAGEVNNLITQAMAIINICIGAYILIRGGVEEAERHFGGY